MIAFLAVFACSGQSPDGGVTGDDDDDITDGVPGETGETDVPPDDTDVVGEPGVSGVLIDADGAPLGQYDVLCCSSVTCFTTETDDAGNFHFDVEGPIDLAMKTHEDLYASPRLAAALEPVHVADALVDIGTLYVPELPAGVRIGDEDEDPQTLAVGDGLELTLNRADLVPDFGVFLYDMAATLLPDEHVPSYELDEEVVAVYAIHPFATGSTSPIAVRMPCDLPAGTAVNVRSVDHLNGLLSEPATGVCNGTSLTTDPGQGVTKLTYLVVSKP